MTAPSEGLSSVRNAARVLKQFLSREPSIGVSELSRRLGLGKSTVHRLLQSLTAEGLVEHDPATGGYRLGLLVFELGEAVRAHLDLHAACGPVLATLRDQTGESCQVGVLDGHEVVYVERLESSYTLRLFTEAGRRVPVHCTSSGKVLVAFLPDSRRQAVLATAPLTALTPNTITDPERVRRRTAGGPPPWLGRRGERARGRGRLGRRPRPRSHGYRRRGDQYRCADRPTTGGAATADSGARRRGRRSGVAPTWVFT